MYSINMRRKLLGKFGKTKLLVLDFDGVLTDGLVYVGEDGYEMVRCNRRDSMGTNMLQKAGIKVFVVSKEKNGVVTMRSKKMGIGCLQNIYDKAGAIKDLSKKLHIPMASICFMGDDINDIEAMKLVGISVAVADASRIIKDIADFVTIRRGGQGAVREICDLIVDTL